MNLYGMRAIWATPFFCFRVLVDFCNSVQEGPRDFLNTPKCSQWPHLYTTCEATYALKCLFSEKIAKNCF